MAFLDNSGDIILDAVLTDAGRQRMAKGDGTFRIAKFGLADDEINYANYKNANAPGGAHPNGSAYYDLEIMQTPVLEAFTNDIASMKSKILSIPKTNLLYLPVLKLNNTDSGEDLSNTFSDGAGVSGIYVVAVDQATEGIDPALVNDSNSKAFKETAAKIGKVGIANSGVLGGFSGAGSLNSNKIVIHQGLDTTEIPIDFSIDSELRENAFIIELDNRLGAVCDPVSRARHAVSFVDDDNIATYYIRGGGLTVNTNLTTGMSKGGGFITPLRRNDSSTLAGPRATRLSFTIRSQVNLVTNTFLFTKLGGEYVYQTRTFYYIDSVVRVKGATTGYQIDVPVRYVKYKSG